MSNVFWLSDAQMAHLCPFFPRQEIAQEDRGIRQAPLQTA